MASHMLYSAHHDFFTPYMDDTKTIVVMDNTGKLTMTKDRDGKGSNKFPEWFLCVKYYFLQPTPNPNPI